MQKLTFSEDIFVKKSPSLYDRRQNFVTKCENVRYRGNDGRLGANFNDNIKLADPKHPQFGTRIWDLSAIPTE